MKQLKYVINLAYFAFQNNPLLYLSVIISVFSVFVELLALSSLLPLLEIVSGSKKITDGFISQALEFIGFEINAKALLMSFVVLFFIRILTQLIAQTLSIYLGRRVMAQLGSRAFDKIMTTISIKELGDKSIGYFISLAGDESYRASSIIISITQFIGTACLGLFYYVAIARFSLDIAGMVFVFLFCTLISLVGVFKASHRLGIKQIEESRSASSVFLDSLNNLKAIRSFSSEKYVIGLYKKMIFRYTRTLFLVDEMSLLSRLLPVILLLSALSVFMIWDITVIEGWDIAFIVTVIVYLMRFFPVVGQGLNILMRIISDAKAGKNVTQMIEVNRGSIKIGEPLMGAVEKIEFNHVYFNYDVNPKKTVLNDVNLIFKKGTSYALSGKSGVGKSTLIDILLKFYGPTSGEVIINEDLLSNISDQAIRKKIVLISQESAIFNDTIINNICMGLETSLLDVENACKQACIHEIIVAMPDKYDTKLQYQGKNLSGGQRQRIAIARALLRTPDVLILDESTSALDKSTQIKIVDNILRDYSNKIVIFVTHDPEIMKQVGHMINLADINKTTLIPF